jgi:hypothetical protein
MRVSAGRIKEASFRLAHLARRSVLAASPQEDPMRQAGTEQVKMAGGSIIRTLIGPLLWARDAGVT